MGSPQCDSRSASCSQSKCNQLEKRWPPALVLPVRDVGRSILPANYFLRPAFCLVHGAIGGFWARWTHGSDSTAITDPFDPVSSRWQAGCRLFEHRFNEPGAIPFKTLKVDCLH
jgi:hypothetical protein